MVYAPRLMAGWPDGVVCAAVVGALLWHVRACHRGRRRSVGLGLRSGDPEVRRAAVLVAISDGARLHLGALSDRALQETDETVLDALALVAEGDRPNLGRRRRARRLLAWAEARLSSGATAHDDRPARPMLPAPTLHLLDALELMDRVTPAAPADPSPGPSLEPVDGRWRVPARSIDALEVVDLVARGMSLSPLGESGVRRRRAVRGVWRSGPDEIDALLASEVTGFDEQHRPARRRTKERAAASG